ncbi:hypothetical protein LCGC14_2519790 [marine sediment metagenome]|uniref:Uncharacterized protein n=1 Tax=marine sediment metagenome TaxID=412755 RepID=A0A0F9AWR5_9ZZZZ
MEIVHKQKETNAQGRERQSAEFELKLANIRGAQVHTAEQIVIQGLRAKGL